MEIRCKMCDFNCETFDDWVDHLMSPGHQQKSSAELPKWTKRMIERSVLVSPIGRESSEDDLAKRQIPNLFGCIEDFAMYGLISDALAESKMKFVIIQYDTCAGVSHSLRKEHVIEGVPLDTKRLSRLSGVQISQLFDPPPVLVEVECLPKSQQVLSTSTWAMQARATEKEDFMFFDRHLRMIQLFKDLDTDQQLTQFIFETTMTEEDIKRRHDFMLNLINIVAPAFPRAILHPFGSFLSRIGDQDSDVDIFLDAEGNRADGSAISNEKRQQIFARALKCIRKNQSEFTQVVPIPLARVPIIKLTHKRTGVKSDLSFENLMSVQNSFMVEFYTRLHPVVRQLILIVRYWARYHDLSGGNQVKNYGLVLLVLVFLTRKGIIPPVYLLQQYAPQPMWINDWNAAFCDNLEVVKQAFGNLEFVRQTIAQTQTANLTKTTIRNRSYSAKEVLILAHEFFDTYAWLKYETQVICSHVGDFLPREYFAPGSEEKLPSELRSYVNWATLQEPVECTLDIASPLCIQDPFNLAFNVGGSAKDIILYKFKAACISASNGIMKTLSMDVPQLLSMVTPLSDKVHFAIKLQQKKKANKRLDANPMKLSVPERLIPGKM